MSDRRAVATGVADGHVSVSAATSRGRAGCGPPIIRGTLRRMRFREVVGVLFVAGIAAGCSSEAPDAVADEHYEWGNVTVDVTTSTMAPKGLALRVTGQPSALVFPSRTPPSLDGALVEATYTCGTPGLSQLMLSSCTLREDETKIPCLEAIFTSQGSVRGNYVDPTGARCTVTAGTAVIRIPRTPPVGTSHDAAVGTFTLECEDAAGEMKLLDGDFAVTTLSLVLLC
jgi:hypothetical protein